MSRLPTVKRPPYETEKRLGYLRRQGIVEAIRLSDGSLPQSGRATVDPDDIERRLYCRRAIQCLAVAQSRQWEALSCESCAVDDPISAEEQRQDMHGLAAILELARIGHALRNRDENKKP